MNKIEFVGVMSGDHERFVWDVAEEQFITLKGRKPNKYEKSCFYKDLFKIYPGDEIPVVVLPKMTFDVFSKVEITQELNEDTYEAKITIKSLKTKPEMR